MKSDVMNQIKSHSAGNLGFTKHIDYITTNRYDKI